MRFLYVAVLAAGLISLAGPRVFADSVCDATSHTDRSASMLQSDSDHGRSSAFDFEGRHWIVGDHSEIADGRRGGDAVWVSKWDNQWDHHDGTGWMGNWNNGRDNGVTSTSTGHGTGWVSVYEPSVLTLLLTSIMALLGLSIVKKIL